MNHDMTKYIIKVHGKPIEFIELHGCIFYRKVEQPTEFDSRTAAELHRIRFGLTDNLSEIVPVQVLR